MTLAGVEEEERVPWWLWAIGIAIGAGGVALAVAMPGNFAYWLAPLLVLVPLWMLTVQFLDPWSQVPAGGRVAARIGGVALALAGAGLVMADPEVRTYLVGVLLLMPLAAVILASWHDDEARRDKGPDVPGSSSSGGLDWL